MEKKIATACLSAGSWALGPVVTLLTNSTKIIGAATRIHSLVAFGAECLEDGGNLLFLPLETILTKFSQANLYSITLNVITITQ